MIDWLTIAVDFKHIPINSGRITCSNPDGTIDWEVPTRTQARGSFEQSTQVKSSGFIDQDGFCTTLLLDGNPSKYLQGHNVFGSDDITYLVELWFRQICFEFNLPYSIFDLNRISYGVFKVTRLDINYMFNLRHSMDVNSFLIALGETGGTKYQRAVNKKGSVYFNLGSRRWSAVFYNKHTEVNVRNKGRRLLMTPEQNRKLLKYVEKAVRAELCIRSIELKDRKMSYGYQIENVGVANIYGEFMKKLDINGNTRVSDKKIINMPSAVKGTYSLWLSNHDVRSLVSRATFYRHKKILREEYGINIDKPTREIGSNVVSINKVMELEPLSCPEFLVASNLVILKRAG